MSTETIQDIRLRFKTETEARQAWESAGGDPDSVDTLTEWGCALSWIGMIHNQPTGQLDTDGIEIMGPALHPETGQPAWHVNALLPHPISREINDQTGVPGTWQPYPGMPAEIIALMPTIATGAVRPANPFRVWAA